MVLSKERGRLHKTSLLDEFDHEVDSDDDEPSEDTNIAAAPEQPEAPIVTDSAPSVSGPQAGDLFRIQVSSLEDCYQEERKDMLL